MPWLLSECNLENRDLMSWLILIVVFQGQDEHEQVEKT